MKTPQELKNEALNVLRGNWAPAIVATIVYILVVMAIVSPSEIMSMKISSAFTLPSSLARLTLFTAGIMVFFLINFELGYYNTFRPFVDSGDNRLTANMFNRGFSPYWHKLGGMVLYAVLITIGLILFIIPGIILILAYGMVPYILDEHPEMSIPDTLRASRHMMRGHKFDLFYFWLTFIGWGILCLLSMGIGFIWLMPYYYTARVGFYNDIKTLAVMEEKF